MKILHVSGINPKKLNGIGNVVFSLLKEQNKLGHNVLLYNIRSFTLMNINALGDPMSFKQAISHFKPEIVIFHSLFNLKYIIYSYFLNKRKIPYLVFPHGAMTTLNHKKGALKKTIAEILFFNRFLKCSKGFIFLNNSEKTLDHFNKIKNKRFIIPNGVEIPNKFIFKSDRDLIKLMFFSRIDIHHKGIDILMEALHTIKSYLKVNSIMFNFYGFGKVQELQRFEDMILKLGLENVNFKGPVFNKVEKDNLFKDADIFVLTSRYEGMPLSVLEALSYGVPCFLTESTNMADIIIDNSCGWITDSAPDKIASSLIKAIEEYKQNKLLFKLNAQNTAQKFQWKEIAVQSINAYQYTISSQNIMPNG